MIKNRHHFMAVKSSILVLSLFLCLWLSQVVLAGSLADLARTIAEQEEDVLEPDGLHLNSRGQRMICELLLELLP